MYSIRSARQLLKLDAHDDGVSALALAPASSSSTNGGSEPPHHLLATGSWDATVKVWALKSSGEMDPSPLAEFFDLAAQVQTVALHAPPSPASTLVAAGAEDGRVGVWELRSRCVVTTFQATVGGAPVAAVRWAGIGVGGGNKDGLPPRPLLYVAGGDGSLGCYDALEGRLLGRGRVDCGELRCLEVATFVDGAAAAYDVLAAGGGDGSLTLWSGAAFLDAAAQAGAPVAPLLVVPDAHAGPVTAVAVDWARGVLATGCQDATVRVWRVRRGPVA